MNARTKRLQVLRTGTWQWVFCWVTNQGRIATTPDWRKAIEDVGSNLAYFSGKTHEEVRGVSAVSAALGVYEGEDNEPLDDGGWLDDEGDDVDGGRRSDADGNL